MKNLNKYGELDGQQCAGCGEAVKADWNHCPKCGKALRKVCEGCGKPMEAEWILCPHCGAGQNYSVVLLAVPSDRKISIIRALRESTPGLGLAEAKTLVESAPCRVMTSKSPEQAKKTVMLLREAGARAETRTP